MSAILTSLSPDLARLEAEGFRLRLVHGSAHHLLIEGIPSVNSEGKVVEGTLYSSLVFDHEGKTVNPVTDHQCWWIGEKPCDQSGTLMEVMISNPDGGDKGDGIVTTVGFSRKKQDLTSYDNYYEKMMTYVQMIWDEAYAIDPTCSPKGEKPVVALVEAQRSIFHYPDMATTRAGIGAATMKLIMDRVAIIGLGGTGSYILDLLAKTPVKQIHLFDRDEFELHNAFRSPGAPSKEQLTDPKKVDWFGDIYDRMRTGIQRHPYHVTADNISELAGYNFAFVAIDNSEARKVILEGLIALGVPFIDVGMDVALDKDGKLDGMLRVTVGTPDKFGHITEVVSFASVDPGDVYRNIQVADLNMHNAALAVSKWKKLCAFYNDTTREHHSTYTVSTHALSKEDKK